jgi:hypothetical protein
MVWIVFEHFKNIRNVKRYNTFVSGVNGRFRGTDVAKIVSDQMHAIYSLGPKIMFWSVLEHFGNLRNVKSKQNLCIRHECTIFGY